MRRDKDQQVVLLFGDHGPPEQGAEQRDVFGGDELERFRKLSFHLRIGQHLVEQIVKLVLREIGAMMVTG